MHKVLFFSGVERRLCAVQRQHADAEADADGICKWAANDANTRITRARWLSDTILACVCETAKQVQKKTHLLSDERISFKHTNKLCEKIINCYINIKAKRLGELSIIIITWWWTWKGMRMSWCVFVCKSTASSREHRKFHCLVQELKFSQSVNFTTSEQTINHTPDISLAKLISCFTAVFKVVIFIVFFVALVKQCSILGPKNK